MYAHDVPGIFAVHCTLNMACIPHDPQELLYQLYPGRMSAGDLKCLLLTEDGGPRPMSD